MAISCAHGATMPDVRESPTCSDMLSMPEQAAAGHRDIRPDDLLGLRDIGPRWRPSQEVFSAISPDGSRMAFFLTRGDPQNNSECRTLVSIPLDGKGKALILDSGGEPIYDLLNIRGIAGDYGYPSVNRPQYSPDGRWIAYLRREKASTQLWIARSDGGGAEQLTHMPDDVELVAWSDDGASVLFATRPSLNAARDAMTKEGQSGFLYDRRMVPFNSSTPALAEDPVYAGFALSLPSRRLRPASAKEREKLIPLPAADTTAFRLLRAKSGSGAGAWTVKDDMKRWMAPISLWAERGGKAWRCPDTPCTGDEMNSLFGLWWSASGKDVLFMRRSGQGNSQTSLMRWRPGALRAETVFSTENLLVGCQISGRLLLCARETSTEPRRIVAFDTRTGRERVIFDPNPQFAGVRLGKVERLQWRGADGVESFGDLVLPPSYEQGRRLPLIVVQYRTRGFLRGGVGDEYPIQLFAARGYAVLSVENPPPFYLRLGDRGWTTWKEAERDNVHAAHERTNVLSSLTTGVQMVIDRGIADPSRIGITGLSDGAATVQFALIHSRLFSAAALSSMGSDSQMMVYGGPALIEERARMGFPLYDPPFDNEGKAHWKATSLAFNPDLPKVPLLMQLADHEYMLGLETYTVLRNHRWPLELYSFPGEYHLKTQAAHRAAIYRRNLAWFDYWLRGLHDPELASDVYERWDKLAREAGRVPDSDIQPALQPDLHIEQGHDAPVIDRAKSGLPRGDHPQ
ncbi:dipeptidyl aminopeptidase/acylaminoacyl peptidase [Novosphingobium sediminicola]|uniref:Dipeptidyl aminopeptidase/acylaminoacyl peptidase n=2 Tax=Novosphingobium sediminicola TaxID=563162 RepID=A0A7W6CIC4_9SPHN|nr:dipeptidyl aminopeptidase/acylaminoacyl peptidase [Novosphingobium sediminicola]